MSLVNFNSWDSVKLETFKIVQVTRKTHGRVQSFGSMNKPLEPPLHYADVQVYCMRVPKFGRR